MTDKKHWYYPTNQLNLGYALARGLITDPSGYGGKYYADLLQDTPGWLPLFPALGAEQLERVTRDAPHLVPVVLELNPGLFQGSAQAVSAQGELHAIQLPDVPDDTSVLLLPLPLPVTLFGKIYFADVTAKKDSLDRWQSQYGNVPIPDRQRLGTRKNLFQRKTTTDLFSDSRELFSGLPERAAIPLNHANTLGALRALLFHYAHRWKSACEFYEWLFLDKDAHPPKDDVLQQARNWRDEPAAAEGGNDKVGLFWCLVNRLQASDTNAADTLLQALEQRQEKMPENYRKRLQSLAGTLRGLEDLGGQTIDELFADNPKPFARALILFFIYDTSKQLLAHQGPPLDPMDVLYALILFAAREGWLALDRDLRHGAGFIAETNDFMARIALKRSGQELQWTVSSQPLLPLYRRLAPADNAREESQAPQRCLELARRMGWDCIHTRIQLPHGSYPLNVSKNGVEISFPGEPRHIHIEVENDVFFEQLEQAHLPQDILAEMLDQ